MAEYIIQGKTLTEIADAIRAKKETTAIFTPEQMAAEIESIVVGDDLPNAEEATFGTVDGYETGILSYGTLASDGSSTMTYGNKFTVVKSFAVYGLRTMCSSKGNSEATLELWDVETSEVLGSVTVTPTGTEEWNNYQFAQPINLVAGKTYMVSRRGLHMAKSSKTSCTFNEKIGSYSGFYSYSSTMPTQADSGIFMVDVLIGQPITESVTTEYKIQLDTLTNIADEVKRITGATGTLSPAQIVTALQGLNITLQSKTVTPTDTAQTVTPDSGYYGLSSVTVEAIPVTEGEATE